MTYGSILFAFLLILALPSPLSAGFRINFQAPDSFKENIVIGHLKLQDNEAFVSTVDLNGDAINEYIVRQGSDATCALQKMCTYHIVAFQENKPITIGQFDAHKIMLSAKKNYGIQQIVVYNDLNNDFKSVIAVWIPFSFRFELR